LVQNYAFHEIAIDQTGTHYPLIFYIFKFYFYICLNIILVLYKFNILRAKTLVSIIFLLTALSCDLTSPPSPADSEVLDGPIGGLTVTEQKIFLRGDVAFNDVFTIQEGLGPVFVANQCAACHPGDGKGSPFVRFTRFGQSDTLGNQYLLQGGAPTST